eukprot:TRINITY_DN1456_c0_g1_i3.p1 TRINITY_DN1456_c0_g1~~TRINITY_DN1456_c0_g1_i3.p1  ORF type:complete len:252 (+),score=58.65 TRINITY_DN1456_c0_g1_i3:132-887(+)
MDSWEDEDDWEAKVDDITLPQQSKSNTLEQNHFEEEDEDKADEDGLDKFLAPDDSKFAGEDEEEDAVADSWEDVTPKPQPKKEQTKKYDESKGQSKSQLDQPLDDPVLEKQRLQRLIEEQDFKATQDLFGTQEVKENPLDKMIPKSEKDFEEYASRLAELYILPHQKHKLYKKLLKEIMKHALEPGTKDLAKEIEQSVSSIRNKKLKVENEEKQKQKSASKKVSLKVGAKGGDAGLEDYQYDDIIDDDDFM